MTASTAITN